MRKIPTALAPLAAALLAACSGTTPPTPQDLDKDICDSLVYSLKKTQGPVTTMDPHQLLGSINEAKAKAPNVEPSPPIADAVRMIERTANMPPSAWIIGVDTLTARCIDAGHIDNP